MSKREKLQERRTSRGFTQESLAALLHVSPRTVRGWEAGTSAPYPEHRQPLADALHLTLDDLDRLLAGPPISNKRSNAPDAATSPAVMPRPGVPPYATALVDRLHRNYQAARYDEVGRALPTVLETVAAMAQDSTGDSRRQALRLQCQAEVVASKLATKFGDGIAAFEAAEQARTAAETADDVFGQASAAYQLTCALVRLGAADEAERHAVATADAFRGTAPDSLTWRGMMTLISAVIAARRGDRSETRQRLDHAGQLAGALGRDDNIGFTAFGPANVHIHRVSTAASADDPHLLLTYADQVDVTTLPTGLHGRQGRFHLDNAWAHTQLGHDPLAVIHLMEAERVAPQLLRTEPTGRTLVGRLMTREHRSKTPGLRALAHRVGVAG